MDREQVVKIAEEVGNDHGCHTVILYGSWARGDATASSDIDLVCVRKEGGAMQDARQVAGVFVDAFIYPESALDEDAGA